MRGWAHFPSSPNRTGTKSRLRSRQTQQRSASVQDGRFCAVTLSRTVEAFLLLLRPPSCAPPTLTGPPSSSSGKAGKV